MEKVLVFGSQGQVARALRERPEASSWIFLGQKDVDLSQPDAILQALNAHNPDVVINPAAYTAVDKAESEKSQAEAVNAQAPEVIAGWVAAHNRKLIHFSTDYVYPGDGESLWTEGSPTKPQNWYGETKLRGDQAVSRSGASAVILRTSWVYSDSGANFVKTMLRLGAERPELKVVADQVGSPTSAHDLAHVTLQIVQNKSFPKSPEIYHAAGQGFVSWHGFAEEIFRQARELGFPLALQKLLPISTAEYPTPAKRPLNSRLDQSKLKNNLGIALPPWQDSLNQVLKKLRS